MGVRVRPAASFNDSIKETALTQVWARPLVNGDIAVGCYNRGAVDPEHPNSPATTGPARDCRFSFAEVGFPAGGSYTVRDCWTATERKGLAAAGGYVAKAVPHHGTALLRVSRTK